LLNRFHGPIDPARELPSVFVSAKINLNIHSIQCRGSLNQRDYNAPAGGGFLLSDWVPAAGRFFTPGEEAIYWSSIEDLRWKIDRYLNAPQERQRVVQQGKARVLRDHTYASRVEQLVYFMTNIYNMV
jgi:spore maturation protein CgeB